MRRADIIATASAADPPVSLILPLVLDVPCKSISQSSFCIDAQRLVTKPLMGELDLAPTATNGARCYGTGVSCLFRISSSLGSVNIKAAVKD